MGKNQKKKAKFGLLGRKISYSFSKGYFTEKFKSLALDSYRYVNFDIETIQEFPLIFQEEIAGLNVTIPYKEQVIPYLDKLDADAKKIGAVNTIKIVNNKLIGFNTDVYGFEESLKPLLKKQHTRALILGTGGASKAVRFVLKKLNIQIQVISRTPTQDEISYQELTKKIIQTHLLVINCTPQGTFPAIEECPNIPYQYITKEHILYDLIYNPLKTKFLLEGEKQGAVISNGLRMLELQAEKSWKIWNDQDK